MKDICYGKDDLWVDKYRPKKFTQLITMDVGQKLRYIILNNVCMRRVVIWKCLDGLISGSLLKNWL